MSNIDPEYLQIIRDVYAEKCENPVSAKIIKEGGYDNVLGLEAINEVIVRCQHVENKECPYDPKRKAIDKEMLMSLSTWFKLRDNGFTGPHSFNDGDVSELMDRVTRFIGDS
mgnify:CR=1 FL=1|tara:strand:+ start:153 stop:488 length:336 start_codon:yes stop_codon:yes gene_type:complete